LQNNHLWKIGLGILHNIRIYRTALVKRIWLALCSQVIQKL